MNLMNIKIENVVFLDIDGVLATNDSSKMKKKFWYDDNAYPFDEKCVKVLNTIIKLTNCNIVLTSSWRLFYTLEEIGKIFDFNKVIKSPIAITEELGDRNIEIEKFVSDNNILKFVLFDDLPLTCYPDKFIRINFKTGLTENNIITTINLFDLNE